jgi:hypothetical protein
MHLDHLGLRQRPFVVGVPMCIWQVCEMQKTASVWFE